MSLAQLFSINEPVGGTSSISISVAYLYFKSIDSNFGIDVQIREVANGVPTSSIVKNSRKTILPSDKYANGVNILTASSDGSAWTAFTFSKPVKLLSQQQYALFVIPHGNVPTYQCWAASLGDVDISSQVPIQFNQSVGPLYFLEPGDQTSTVNKAIKFLLQNAICSNPRHHSDWYNFNEEHIVVNNLSNNFILGETCYISKEQFNLAWVEITSNTVPFINGEAFYQNIGTTNILGNIYTANNSVLLLNNVSDINNLSNSYPIIGVSSGSSASPVVVDTDVVVSTLSNVINIPFTGNNTSTLFYVNQSIYLSSSDLSINQCFVVTGITATSLQISWTPNFSNTNALIGTIRGDNLSLHAEWQGYDDIKQTNFIATFNNSTANIQIASDFHFGDSVGCLIFGQASQSRCISYGTVDLEYHSVIPQMCFDNSKENDHQLYWGGYSTWKAWQSSYPINWRYSKK